MIWTQGRASALRAQRLYSAVTTAVRDRDTHPLTITALLAAIDRLGADPFLPDADRRKLERVAVPLRAVQALDDFYLAPSCNSQYDVVD